MCPDGLLVGAFAIPINAATTAAAARTAAATIFINAFLDDVPPIGAVTVLDGSTGGDAITEVRSGPLSGAERSRPVHRCPSQNRCLPKSPMGSSYHPALGIAATSRHDHAFSPGFTVRHTRQVTGGR
jgi:hypothetical protein